MKKYELVNERYGNERVEITIEELRTLLRDVFGDTDTELVERPDGIYEIGGELVAEAVTNLSKHTREDATQKGYRVKRSGELPPVVVTDVDISGSHIRKNVKSHLRGRRVQHFVSPHHGPADDEAVLQGQETGVVDRTVIWYTVDGVPVNDLSIPELRRIGMLRW